MSAFGHIPRQPTGDECSAGALVDLPDGQIGKALWYPTMGGYVGKCVIVPEGTCFDAFVWHDGDFPFGDDVSPVQLHHCNALQFVKFGETVAAFLGNGEAGVIGQLIERAETADRIARRAYVDKQTATKMAADQYVEIQKLRARVAELEGAQ